MAAVSKRRRGGGGRLPGTRRHERYLPAVVLVNILVRLSAASLHRLRRVSKQWSEVIADRHFAEAHLATPRSLEFDFTLIFRCCNDNIFLQTRRSSTSSLLSAIPRCHSLPKDKATVYGSCKGLLLLRFTELAYPFDNQSIIHEVVLYLANPITGYTMQLPCFPSVCGYLKIASIALDPSSRKLKVVIVAGNICAVLTVGSNTWRVVHRTFPHCLDREPSFAGGELHWKLHNSIIISMDVAREKFRQTKVPFCTPNELDKHSILLEWDGSLAVVKNSPPPSQLQYRIWLLRDSGWLEMQPNIDNVAFFRTMCPPETFSDDDIAPYPVASLRDGQIIIFWIPRKEDNHFLTFDIKGRIMTPFTVSALHGRSTRQYNFRFLAHGISSVLPHLNSVASS